MVVSGLVTTPSSPGLAVAGGEGSTTAILSLVFFFLGCGGYHSKQSQHKDNKVKAEGDGQCCDLGVFFRQMDRGSTVLSIIFVFGMRWTVERNRWHSRSNDSRDCPYGNDTRLPRRSWGIVAAFPNVI